MDKLLSLSRRSFLRLLALAGASLAIPPRPAQAQRTATWFICPYDVVLDPTLMRRCAMCRYIPVIPNAAGNDWDEIELRGNATLVKVSATASVLTAMRADVDFGEVVMADPVTSRTLTRLQLLGYTTAELGTGTGAEVLRRAVTTRSRITLNATRDGLVIGLPVANTVKTFDRTNTRVPG